MPATILDYTAGDTERGVKIQNSQIFRKVKDDTWTTLRVGVRWIPDDDTGSNPSAGAQWALGLCNGDTEGMGSANRKHCVVITNVTSGGTISTLTREADSDAYGWQYVPGHQRFCKYLNNVQTVVTDSPVGSLVNSRVVFSGVASNFYATILLFDITRASPNYTLQAFMRTSSTLVNTSRQVFLEQMEATSPSLTGYQFTTTPRTVSIDEVTDGVLDHFHFYWNRTAPSIMLLDTAVCKIA